MRTRSPARCTPPSRIFVTPSCSRNALHRQFRVAEALDRSARDHLHRAHLGELREDVVVDAVDEVDVVRAWRCDSRMEGRRSRGECRSDVGCAVSAPRRRSAALARAFVAPEDAAAEQEKQRDDGEFGTRVTRCSPRSPWYQAITRTIGRPIRSARIATWLSCPGQSKASLTYCEALQESPGTRGIGDPPLHHLARRSLAQSALLRTLCRRVGHVPAPLVVGSVHTASGRRKSCCAELAAVAVRESPVRLRRGSRRPHRS